MFFQLFWDDPNKRNLKLKSVSQVVKLFKENPTYNLIGPIDFDVDKQCWSLQIWIEDGTKGDYLGDIYCKSKSFLKVLYNEIYPEGKVKT